MALFFVSQIAASGVTLLVFLALTRLLGPAEFGAYNMIVLSGAVAFDILFGWMGAAVTRFHFAEEFNKRAIAVVLGALVRMVIVLVPLAVVVAFYVPAAWVIPMVLAGLYCLCHASHDLMISCLRVYRAGKPFAVAIIGRPLVGLVFALLLVVAGFGVTGAVVGMAAGAAAMGGFALTRVYGRSGIQRPDLPALRQFVYFGFPLAVVASASSALALLTQSALASIVSLQAVGIFAATQVLTMRTIGMPMTVLSRVNSPNVYSAFERHGRAAAQTELNVHFSFLMLMTGPVVLTLFTANQTVARALLDPAYSGQVAEMLPILTLAAFLTGMRGAFFSFCFTISQRTWIQFTIIGGTVLGHAAVAFVMVYLFGLIGAAYGVLLTAALALGVFAYFGRRVYPISLPLAEAVRIAVAVLCAAPFGFYADTIAELPVALAYIALQASVFVIVLALSGQAATRVILSKLWARAARSRPQAPAE
ncbi:MAG: oligosaccharide flippase family protein [Pseudomonadota bacterium]